MRPVRFVFLPMFLLTTLFSTMVRAQSTPDISTPVISSSTPLVSKSAVDGLSQPDPARQAKMVESYGKLPLSFEANQGQADARVKFLSRTGGYTLFLTGKEAVLEWSGSAAKKPAPKGAPGFGGDAVSRKRYPDTKQNLAAAPSVRGGVLRMKLLNANAKTEVSGQDELSGKSNYFIGNEPKKWHTNVPQFAKVRYENVYPGVDLVYYGHQRELEYDFVLQPGINPQAIRLGIAGAKRLRLEHGDLVLTSAGGDVRLRSPQIYQEANGARQEVRGRYVIKSKNEVGFEVAAYDRRRALVIDPVLAYSTFLGGYDSLAGYNNRAFAIAVDSVGNAYVTGFTDSASFPTRSALQPALNGVYDAFVTKFNADGTGLIYSTYLGGSDVDVGSGIAADATGNAYVTGRTSSTDFPTKNAIQPTLHGPTNAFVTKINASGSAFVYSTYLGGSGNGDWGAGIAVDAKGNAYVTGGTNSTDFPIKNALQPTLHGFPNAFVTKINSSGSAFVYSTYLGGSGFGGDSGAGIAADATGNAYVTGQTSSTDFPIKNAFQPNYGGSGDAFVTKINASGSAFAYSTYLGGSGWDSGAGLAVDSTGNAYVTGGTSSADFPTKNAIQPNNGGWNAFVTKMSAAGGGLVYSTYLGGSGGFLGIPSGAGIGVDSQGNAYVAGTTDATNFPTVDAIRPNFNGGYEDAFVTKINASGSAWLYSTYFGGSADDFAAGIAVNSVGTAFVTGTTSSTSSFPRTLLAFQRGRVGDYDAFIAKIASQTFLTFSHSGLTFPLQLLGTTSAAKTITVTNQGSSSVTINGIYLAGNDPTPFGETNTCVTSLASNTSCTISVTFTPGVHGRRQRYWFSATPTQQVRRSSRYKEGGR